MCSFGSSGASAPTTQFTTQTTTADPRAQAMYGQAFNTAQRAANRPFTPYSYDPNAFVAPINPLQLQAMGNIAGYQGAADPYYQMAGGMAGLSGMTTAPQVVSQYMSPYMREVIDPTRQALEQQQGMQLAQQQAEAIKGGAFGGERAGLQRAALRGQQQLGLGQALAPLYQAGYGQSLQAAQGDLNRQLQAAQVMGGLGTGAQTAGLQGAQALLGAGTLGQQTQQAGLQALFNQYMLQQQYPFMASQFLTQAAAGLGPGYGGTTTGQQTSYQPLSYFGNPLSDPDLKTGAGDDDEPQVIGETKDGQKIYRYRLIDPDTGELGPAQIGLMADEVEQRTPEAIGDYKGYRTVDYAKATDDAARLGGGVTGRGDYAYGGRAGYQYGGADDDLSGLIASHGAMYKPMGETMSKGIVPASQITPARLESAELKYMTPEQRQKSSLAQNLDSALGLVKGGKEAYGLGKEALGAAGGLGSLGSMLGGAGTVGATGGVPVGVIGALGAKAVPTFGAAASAASPGFLAGLGAAAMKALPFLAALSDPSLKTGVRPKAADGMSVSPDDQGLDYLARTLVREAGGEGEKGMEAVADVIRNRLQSGRYGSSIQDVVTAPKQFSPWNPEARGTRADPRLVDPSSKLYQTARGIGERVMGGAEDVTGGATHFYNPDLASPKWGAGMQDAQMIGRHRFGRADAGALPLAYTSTEKPGLGGALDAVSRIGGGTMRSDATEASTPAEPPSTGIVPSRMASAPEGITGLLRGTAPEGVGERAADFLTSEKFIVPLLAGLGTMASSGSRFLGPAVLQGIGGGAKAYAELAQQQFEREKMAEELGLKKRGIGVEELKADLALKQYQQQMEQAKKLAEAFGPSAHSPAGAPPSATPRAAGVAETPEIRAAQEEAEKFRKMIAVSPDAETAQKNIANYQRAQQRVDELRRESPERIEKTEGAKLRAKQYADLEAQIQSSGTQAQQNIDNLNITKTALSGTGVYTGPGAERFLQLKQTLDAIGYPGLKEGIANTEFFRSMSNKMVTAATGGSLGAGISNADVNFLRQAQANMGTTKEGNNKIIDMAIKLEKRKQEIADLQDKYGSVDKNFQKHLRDWAKEHPLFSETDLPPKSEAPPSSLDELRKKYPNMTEQQMRDMYEKMKKGQP